MIEAYTLEELREINKSLKYKYSQSSMKKLATVDKNLAWIFLEGAGYFDIRIIYGFRSPEEQYDLYLQGFSDKDGYQNLSMHQKGLAIDVIPLFKGGNIYKNTRENALRWAYFVGFMKSIALQRGIRVRNGWKWREDPTEELSRPLYKNSLIDPAHFELI